jgi:repressor LexA
VSDVGETIRELRERRGYSQESLAHMIGTTKQAICHYEKNRRKVSLEVASKIAEVLNVPVSRLIDIPEKRLQLLEGISAATYLPRSSTDLGPLASIIQDYVPSMIPVIGSVRAGAGGLAFEDREGVEPAHIQGRAEDYFYLKVVGNSMAPHINEGDLALIRIQPTAESGDLVVALIDEEEGTIKKLLKKSGTIVLQAFNPEHPPRIFTGREMNSVRIVGKVVQTVRKWD